MPGKCKRECHNDFPFDFVEHVSFKKYDKIQDIFDLIRKNEKTAAFALLKVNDSFNFFNSLAPVLEEKPTS
jgi:hypothetical protein